MKYAVVKTGGKQYLVEESEEILVEKIEGGQGDKISFGEVLLVVDGDRVEIGKPFLKGTQVEAVIVAQIKDKKIEGFKYKPKKGYRRHWGHRQNLTKIQIEKILA